MAESAGWKRQHESLIGFIAAHPEIILSANAVAIPERLRDEFYQRFDQLRRAVVEDSYSSLPDEVEVLSASYLEIERAVKELLGLEAISMPTDLVAFLRSPREGLIRSLHGRTFDLLQGKVGMADFERLARADLQAAAADLLRFGYDLWAALVVIKLLRPDQAFQVDLDDYHKLFLRDLKDIAFGRQAHHPTMRIPEFVLHSRAIGRYVAVKMLLVQEVDIFALHFRPPSKPKKRTGDTSSVLGSRVMTLSLMPDLGTVPVLADIYEAKINSPDLAIESVTRRDLSHPESIARVEKHVDALHPKRGFCLLVTDPGRNTRPASVPASVRAIAAGFDQSRLQGVIDMLSGQAREL